MRGPNITNINRRHNTIMKKSSEKGEKEHNFRQNKKSEPITQTLLYTLSMEAKCTFLKNI